MMRITGFPVIYSGYASDEPQYVPDIGFIAKDKESLEKFLAKFPDIKIQFEEKKAE